MVASLIQCIVLIGYLLLLAFYLWAMTSKLWDILDYDLERFDKALSEIKEKPRVV